MESIAFGGLTYRNRYSVSSSFSWTPLSDQSVVSLLLMPGQFSGTTWVDLSTHARNAVGGASVDPNGCPTFNGLDDTLTVTGASLADNVTYPGASMSSLNNGSMVVVSKQAGPLPTDTGNYSNPATINGDDASPGLYQTATGARCTAYDGTAYVDHFAAGGVFAADVGHVQFGAWDSVGLYCACDALALGSVTPYNSPHTSISAGNVGPDTWIGRSFGALFTGVIYAVAVYPTKVTDETVSNWTKWARVKGFI